MGGTRFAVLVAAAVLGGVIGGAAPHVLARGRPAFADRQDAAKIVRAEKIELVDRGGRARAWLETDPDGNPGLFLGREDCIMASFSLVGTGKPRLDFADDCGVRALLQVDARGNPSFTIFDRNRKTV